jgi:hypothetical protein
MGEAKFIVDRVAEAIARAVIMQKTPNFHILALAAIEAMREPTVEVIEACTEYAYEGWGDPAVIATKCWHAGIDAALGKVDA